MARKKRPPAEIKPQTPTPPNLRRPMLLLVLLAQLATLLITWPVWNVRASPVNLPLLDGPWFSFGWLMVATLLVAAVRPRAGVIAHTVVFAVGCAADMWRLQPQVVSLIVLMFACLDDHGAWFGRVYLATMWLWSGLHKFLSPEWFGSSAWTFCHACGLPADEVYWWFALVVAVTEVALGVAAFFASRPAAIGCVFLHLGILLSLSPLVRNFNMSVWPWNLATAIVGAWLFWRTIESPRPAVRYAIIAAMLIVPAGFYGNLLNPHLAYVLYSGNMPSAIHIHKQGVQRLDGWQKNELTVPFPDSPRMFVEIFRRTAAPGDKLFIYDPRAGLRHRYYLMTSAGVQRLSRAAFLRRDTAGREVRGIEMENHNAVFALRRAGAKLELDADRFVITLELTGDRITDDTLRHVAGLPNLRELRISDSAITDAGLAPIAALENLEILVIQRASITSAGLARIAPLSSLQWLELDGTDIDDSAAGSIGQLPNLTVLNLSHTRLTSAGVHRLPNLPRCQWLNLAGTQIDDDALPALRVWPALETLELGDTKISDAGVQHLAEMKTLTHVNLQGTRVTAGGAQQLRAALPACDVIH